MYAVIETGSKQYRIKENDEIEVEKMDVEPGTDLKLDKVLFFTDGKDVRIGCPYLENINVLAEVRQHQRGRKLVSFKYRRRKSSRWKKGHRQELTLLRIKEIKPAA